MKAGQPDLSGNCSGTAYDLSGPQNTFSKFFENLSLGVAGSPATVVLGIVQELFGICLGLKMQFGILFRILAWRAKAGPQSCRGIVGESSRICLGLNIESWSLCRIWSWGRKAGPPELSGTCLGIVWELSRPQTQNLNICRI